MPLSPAVSVIIATYNRSQALRHAIQSVLDQTRRDWELIIIGDACTDDTAAVVATFNDPRIRFENLTTRFGYQSGPNNRGLELATARYVAFLNHDDLYFPDHLAVTLAALEQSDADLVWVPTAIALPRNAGAVTALPFAFDVAGLSATDGYRPTSFYFASSLAFRREIADRVGPWLAPTATYLLPSQEWLFRAWRRGARMRIVPAVTVVALPAGMWPQSYGRRACPEHETLARLMREVTTLREHILAELFIREAKAGLSDRTKAVWRRMRRLLLRPVYAALLALGLHPHVPLAILNQRRRGWWVERHAATSGAH